MNASAILESVSVDLGERSYPIYIGSGIRADLPGVCREHRVAEKIVIVTDRNVSRHHLKRVSRSLSDAGYRVMPVVVPSGERQKSLSRVSRIVTEMLEHGVQRRSALMALGGGVIGDLAGFVAATYQRGIQLIQLPTSLLAQVDSSIGGKVGVNHPLAKNMIGAFYQPLFVWSDVEVLKTLPRREVVCGLGEVVKYGIIRDPDLFSHLEKNLDTILSLDRKDILHMLRRCALIKADIVAQDEREQGIRIVLNCGHTIGHALEHAGEYRKLKHGEAVMHGLLAEGFIARELGILSATDFQRISNLISRMPIPRNLSSLKPSAILRAMARDKKALADQVRFVLPCCIGETQVVEGIDLTLIKRSLAMLLGKR